MIGRRAFLTLTAAASAALIAATPAAVQAERGDGLTDALKSHLMAAEPVQDRAVTRETFNGKPLLVIFFASW